MITIKSKGNFKKTDSLLAKILKRDYVTVLTKYGQLGVEALRNATPVDTGLTANSWSYEIVEDSSGIKIYWKNSNIVKGVPIAVILQYGHATNNGGHVEGVDYINPAIKPLFEDLASRVWEEVMH